MEATEQMDSNNIIATNDTATSSSQVRVVAKVSHESSHQEWSTSTSGFRLAPNVAEAQQKVMNSGGEKQQQSIPIHYGVSAEEHERLHQQQQQSLQKEQRQTQQSQSTQQSNLIQQTQQPQFIQQTQQSQQTSLTQQTRREYNVPIQLASNIPASQPAALTTSQSLTSQQTLQTNMSQQSSVSSNVSQGLQDQGDPHPQPLTSVEGVNQGVQGHGVSQPQPCSPVHSAPNEHIKDQNTLQGPAHLQGQVSANAPRLPSQEQQEHQQQTQSTAYPSNFKLRDEMPVQQERVKVYAAQPAFKSTRPLKLRGDSKWPPTEGQADTTQQEVRQFVKPKKQCKDYTSFFAANALPASYTGYRAPPGTQHMRGAGDDQDEQGTNM